MPDPLEVLQKLKEDTALLLSNYQDQSQVLDKSIQGLRCQLVGIERSIEALVAAAAAERYDSDTPPLPNAGKYSDTPLTPAVLDVIEHTNSGIGLLVPEIIQKLTAEGFKSDAENLYASVYSVAMRLVKQKKINEGKVGGKRVFVKKQPF